ncbi:endolytic transglycosylase MltG, partial [Patescibacteria group bacterium]|nr:endolytic transglycosylase MltG [Patescibacteria group bacterium]
MDEEPKIQVSPNRRNLLIVTILAVVLTFPTIPALLYKYAIDAPSRNTQVVEFDIEQGMSVSDISVALYEEGVIESPIIFKVFIRINNLQSKIQAGVYNIEPKTSIVELASLFGLGTNDTKLTFIEGWRREEFAQYAAESLKNVSYAEFVAKTQNLEGKLFPDTYFLSEDVTTQELIDKLASTFEEKTVDLLTDSKLAVLGMTEDEVITLASIIEREVHSEDARKLVAGILLKRLREGMPLQADATTQYAVAWDKH